MAGKYKPLHDHLAALARKGDVSVQLSFDLLDKIVNDITSKVRQYPRFTIFDDVNVQMENGVATLAFRGSLTAAHKYPPENGKLNAGSADICGAATFDVKTGRMQSLTLIFDGTYRHFAPYDKDVSVTVAGAEWRSEKTARK